MAPRKKPEIKPEKLRMAAARLLELSAAFSHGKPRPEDAEAMKVLGSVIESLLDLPRAENVERGRALFVDLVEGIQDLYEKLRDGEINREQLREKLDELITPHRFSWVDDRTEQKQRVKREGTDLKPVNITEDSREKITFQKRYEKILDVLSSVRFKEIDDAGYDEGSPRKAAVRKLDQVFQSKSIRHFYYTKKGQPSLLPSRSHFGVFIDQLKTLDHAMRVLGFNIKEANAALDAVIDVRSKATKAEETQAEEEIQAREQGHSPDEEV